MQAQTTNLVRRHPTLWLWVAVLLPCASLLVTKAAFVGWYGMATRNLAAGELIRQAEVRRVERKLSELQNLRIEEVKRELAPRTLEKLSSISNKIPNSLSPLASTPKALTSDGAWRNLLSEQPDKTDAQSLAQISSSPANGTIQTERYRLKDAASGSEYSLSFTDSTLRYTSLDLSIPLGLDISRWQLAQEIRDHLMVLVIMFWVFAFLASLVFWRARRYLAKITFGLALLWAANAQLSESYGNFLTDSESVATILPGLVLVAMSVVVLLLPKPMRERVHSSRCRSCGYDLRGNVSGICPECGTQLPTRWWVAIAQQMGALPVTSSSDVRLGAPAAPNDHKNSSR